MSRIKARDDKRLRVVEAYRPDEKLNAEIIKRVLDDREYSKTLNNTKII